MNPLLFENLLRRALERMELINGPEEKCVYAGCRHAEGSANCPNHQLIREIEQALSDHDLVKCKNETGEIKP